MKLPNRRKLLTGVASAAFGSAFPFIARSKNRDIPPNIVFILADDLGYADIGVYGQTQFRTPHIDKLAAQSVILEQAYSNSAVCSATRVALMTGRYQYRLRVGLEEPIGPEEHKLGLPEEHPTLPSLLKNAGYETALIGKWHLGYLPAYSPMKSGYDEFFGNFGGAIDYFSHKGFSATMDGLYQGETQIEEQGYYTQLITNHAKTYLRHRSKNRPFFLSIHYTAPHWPWEGPEDFEISKNLKSLFHYDGGTLKKYGEMVEALDVAVGDVLLCLDDLGLSENTIVIFTSDNGGERFSNSWPYSGQKTELLEGGIRVPALIRWPGHLPENRRSDIVCMTMDWLPTLLSAARAQEDKNYPSDGMDILPALYGITTVKPRKLYWRYKAHNQRAMRYANFKYLKIGENEFLFDILKDTRERANLKELYPEVFTALKNDWEEWNKTMLPITDDVHTHWIKSPNQADHYNPD